SGTCFPRKRISSKSLKVGMIPAPKRVCLIQEPKEARTHQYSRAEACSQNGSLVPLQSPARFSNH
ncbi:SUGP2 isoform 11, partial [Pan troglodytes]